MHLIQVNLGLVPPCEDVFQARNNVIRLLCQRGASQTDLEDIIFQAVYELNNENYDLEEHRRIRREARDHVYEKPVVKVVKFSSKSIASTKFSSQDGSVQKRKGCTTAMKSERIGIKQHLSVFRDFLSQDKNGICIWKNDND